MKVLSDRIAFLSVAYFQAIPHPRPPFLKKMAKNYLKKILKIAQMYMSIPLDLASLPLNLLHTTAFF